MELNIKKDGRLIILLIFFLGMYWLYKTYKLNEGMLFSATLKKNAMIVNDNCSDASMLKSDYRDNMCETYAGDYTLINEKCNALNNELCNLTDCCVALNGQKCVAGNRTGPIFSTKKGENIKFTYYTYQNQRYPELNPQNLNKYTGACQAYADNSTEISKACMIELFNDAGCANTNPFEFITDDYVFQKREDTKRSIQQDLSVYVKKLKNPDKDSAITSDNAIRCNGVITEADKYYSYDTNLNMESMYTIFLAERENQFAQYKQDMFMKKGRIAMNLEDITGNFVTAAYVNSLKNSTKIDVISHIRTQVEQQIQRLVKGLVLPCDSYKNNEKGVSKECMFQLFADVTNQCPTPNNFITAAYMKKYNKFTKEGIKSDIAKRVKALKLSKKTAPLLKPNGTFLNSDNTLLCYGADSSNQCDAYLSEDTKVSQECMEEIFRIQRKEKINVKYKQRRIPQKVLPSFIDSTYTASLAKEKKKTVIQLIDKRLERMIGDYFKKF